MNKLVVTFNDLKAVEELRRLGIISYIPKLHETAKIVFVETDMNKEALMKIDGVTKVRDQKTYSLNI